MKPFPEDDIGMNAEVPVEWFNAIYTPDVFGENKAAEARRQPIYPRPKHWPDPEKVGQHLEAVASGRHEQLVD